MQIQLKKLGKKKIKIIDISLEKHPKTLRELITECVKSEVRRFNDSREDTSLLPFLSAKEIGEQAQAGKITCGEKENRQLADLNKAIDTAMLAFTDGLFAVFINEEEIQDLDTPIHLTEQSTLTFIRLTFLTGTYW